MSIQLIQQYYTKVEQIIRYGGSRNESSLRKPFQDLLEQYTRAIDKSQPCKHQTLDKDILSMLAGFGVFLHA